MATAPPSYQDATADVKGYPKQSYPVYQSQPPYPQQTYPPYPVTLPPQNNASQPIYDATGDENFQNDSFVSFSDKSMRRAFIRKVYLILTAQLLVTCLFISILQFVKPIRLWVQTNSWFYFLSYAVFIVTYIALVCCPSVRRRYPGNFIALSIFTFAFSYMTATIASFYDAPAVLSAAAITAILCLSISIFAIQTKVDFTLYSGLILVLSIVLILTGVVCGILYAVYPSKILHGLYAGLAILVFGLYLIYDTQMIMGGRRYELSPEDYIEGALQLYLDVVNLFLIILSLFGNKN